MALALCAAVSLLLSSSTVGAAPNITGQGGDPPTVDLAAARYVVLIVLDGARPDYLKVAPLPHLDALIAQGTEYTGALTGILESETPSGHTTISTGSTPRRNGILGFNWGRGEGDYSLFSPAVVRSGAIEQIMQAAHIPTIASLYKARYPHGRVVALSGYKYYAADPLGGPQADAIIYFRNDAQNKYYSPTAIPGHVPPYGVLENPSLTVSATGGWYGRDDHLATALALSAFAHMHQQVTLINYPDTDWPLGHVDGGDLSKPKVVQLMRTFDQDLAWIEDTYRRARILDKTLFVITADHGMTPVRRFVPWTVFSTAVTNAGTRLSAATYSTAAYLWLHDVHKASRVAANIVASKDPGIDTVYYWSAARQQYVRSPGAPVSAALEAANQYLLATLVNGHQPSVVAFCHRYNSAQSPTTHWKADHGGADWQSQHIPLVLSGPGIRRGAVVTAPAQLEDIAPTVLRELGVSPVGMEGQVLSDALTSPASADASVRATEIARLQPVVKALATQDRSERHR